MRLYRTTAGEWAGTQADARALAGKAWQEVDVPTDKPGLLAFLNGRRTQELPELALDNMGRETDLGDFDGGDELAPTPPAPRIDPDSCPKCARRPRAAEQLAMGDDIEAIGEWLWRSAPWQLERLFGIMAGRMAQLRDAAVTQ